MGGVNQSLRHRAFSAGFRLLAAGRAERWLAPLARGAGVILMFHHVRPWRPRAFAPNRLLEITPAYLDHALGLVRAMGFDLIALDEASDRLRMRPGQKPFAVLTFDDGYRDNAEHALPILKRHGAPWTLFVTADYAGGEGRLWWIELEEAIARLDRIALAISDRPLDLPTRTPREKQAAFETIYWRLRAGPEERLRAVIAKLADQAGIDAAGLVRSLCLDWSELRTLAREPGVVIGAHTLSHPMLAKHDRAAAWREIAGSRDAIVAKLGQAPRHFAYPVGDPTSAGPRDFRLAAEAGFETAVTTRPGHVFAEHAGHLHALPRVSVNGLFQTEAALKALLSGVPLLAWNRGRRLNVG
jgi:peptidoglycan/xylan/chitin deacetylase (PgdA/CDA1 family)